jgi:6-phospho-3-hexuloisomerase
MNISGCRLPIYVDSRKPPTKGGVKMEPLYLRMLEELYENTKGVFKELEESELEEVVAMLLRSKKIFVLGIGHSGTFGRIFAMKLTHVGLDAYTVFDEINPPFGREDVFVAISQSGETSSIITLVHKARKLGGKIIGITSTPGSTLTKLSDSLLKIREYSEEEEFETLSAIGDTKNQNLLGLLFGLSIYVLFYTIVIMIARERGETPASIDARHANLQ